MNGALTTYPNAVPIRAIQDMTARYFRIPPREMRSKGRAQRVARPRQVAMFLSVRLTSHSLPEIGRKFRRDHTTVMHARRKIEDLMARDPAFKSSVDHLFETIPLSLDSLEDPQLADLREAARLAENALIKWVKEGTVHQAVTGPASKLRAGLAEVFHEFPVSTAKSPNGEKVELLISQQQTWSLIEVAADDEARLIAFGTNWSGGEGALAGTHLLAPPAGHLGMEWPRIIKCNLCHQDFQSEGPWNRRCRHCNETVQKYDSNIAEGFSG